MSVTSEKKYRYLYRAVGPIALIVTLWWVGSADMLSIISQVDILIFALAVIMGIALGICRGYRWWVLTGSAKKSMPLPRCIGMYCYGMALSAVTPGRVGDFVKVLRLKTAGYSMSSGFAISLVDRFIDMLLLMVVGGWGLLYLATFTELHSAWNVAILIAGLLLVVIPSLRAGRIGRMLQRLFSTSKAVSHLSSLLSDYEKTLKGLSITRILALFTLTIIAWFFFFIQVYLVGLSLGLSVSFLMVMTCTALSSICSFLPITIAGAGSRDGIFLFILGSIGISQSESLSFSCLVLLLFFCNALIFYLLSLLDPISRCMEHEDSDNV